LTGHALLKSDRRLTVREMSDEVGVLIGSCYPVVIEDLGMGQVGTKIVQHILTAEQEENTTH
jgi:hypothetical protein